MDHVLESLLDLGLERGDLEKLERLSDAKILRRIASERRPLDKRSQRDLVLYLRTWADLLEERWLAGRELPASLPAAVTMVAS